jgi:hypothetical protein
MERLRRLPSLQYGGGDDAGRRDGTVGRRGMIRDEIPRGGTGKMLWTIVALLIVLWALGLVTSYTMGGLIHVLLVIAIVVVLINVIQGRKAL